MDLLKNQFQCIRMNQDVPSHSEAELKRTSKPVSKRMKKQRRKLEDYARFQTDGYKSQLITPTKRDNFFDEHKFQVSKRSAGEFENIDHYENIELTKKALHFDLVSEDLESSDDEFETQCTLKDHHY